MGSLSLETGPVSHKEAEQILSRFNASHWNNPGEHARYSIPARADDDDIRLAAYIEQNKAREAELERVRQALKLVARNAAARVGGSRR